MKSKIQQSQNNNQHKIVKTTINIKKTAQIIIVSAILISSLIVTRTILKNVKHQYSTLSAGSGKAFFYDMMQ